MADIETGPDGRKFMRDRNGRPHVAATRAELYERQEAVNVAVEGTLNSVADWLEQRNPDLALEFVAVFFLPGTAG